MGLQSAEGFAGVGGCFGNCVPAKAMKSEPPGPRNVILFGSKVFVDGTRMRSYQNRATPPSSMTGVLRRREDRHTSGRVTHQPSVM